MARAGGSRGGGGGSRGFSGGSGRSFGGRTGGSPGGSYQRGGVQGGSKPGGAGRSPGSFGSPGGLGGPSRRPPPPPPPRGGIPGYGPGLGGGYGFGGPGLYGYGRYNDPYYRRRRRYGNGCLTAVIAVLLVVFCTVTVLGASVAEPLRAEITKSTIQREKLPGGAVDETGYYTDELGWVRNPTLLLPGMQHFYEKTGVQPYLYLTDNIGGSTNPSDAQVQQFAEGLYDDLFTDEAHFLLIFLEYQQQYHTWYLAGAQAKSVMDLEASNILLDYVDDYYYRDGLSDEQFFSNAFRDAGDRIMSVTRSPWIPVLIVLGVLALLVVLFLWWRGAQRQKTLEAERTARVLETPLETFGDARLEELEDKYTNDPYNKR